MLNIYLKSGDKPEVEKRDLNNKKILGLGGFLFKVARKPRTSESTFKSLWLILTYFSSAI